MSTCRGECVCVLLHKDPHLGAHLPLDVRGDSARTPSPPTYHIDLSIANIYSRWEAGGIFHEALFVLLVCNIQVVSVSA